MSEAARLVLQFIALLTGITLPLSVVVTLDGYLKYLRGYEILEVYSYAWIAYALAGTVIGVVTLAGVRLGRVALRRSGRFVWEVGQTAFLSLALLSFLAAAARGWLDPAGLRTLVEWKWGVVAGLIVLASLPTVLREVLLANLRSMAVFASVAGGVTALVCLPVLALTSPSASVAAASPPAPTVELPPVILITADAMSGKHMSLYGYPRRTSPQLEAFAQQATVFRRYYANSNFTTATVNSFIHGVRPWRHRALHTWGRPEPALVTGGLLPALQRAGYRVNTVSTNYWASPLHALVSPWVHRAAYGQVRQLYEAVISALPERQQLVALRVPLPPGFATMTAVLERLIVEAGVWRPADHFDPELPMSTARAMLERADRHTPVMLWVHLFPPHNPYAAPAPFARRFDSTNDHLTRFAPAPPVQFTAGADRSFPDHYVGRYDESIAYVDQHIGLFLSWMRSRGLFDRALVIFSADHGESFSHQYGTHGGPLLHDDLIRVPLIIKEPYQTTPRVSDVVAEQVDLLPTILDALGLPMPADRDGRSLLPAMRGKDLPEKAVFSMNFEQSSRFGPLDKGTVAMISGPWKYVHYIGEQRYPLMRPLSDALFRLDQDSLESRNIVADYPQLAQGMREEIRLELKRHGGALQ